MEPGRWQRLAEWFDRALDEPEEAERLVAALRLEDPDLAEELAALLAEAASGLDTGPDRLAAIVDQAAGWLEGGDGGTVGPYRLIGEVGRGGSGTVYLATRADEGFPLNVALKMVDRRFASRRDRERLIEERRILATLDHPNIARVFDAGTAADGTPYFVLEHIQGEPIDRHCDRLRLTVPERLELFLGVCEAVAYAHRRLVIHRDIKPSNILVSAQGVPKLLDFGIAKVLEDDRAGLTQPGERLLTPAFASPEQVAGDALTTATDLYSLGALLFVLLAGRPPLPVDGLRPAEIERRICEEEPPLASVAASEDAGATAELRRSSPARLRRRLRGDLDTIVAKALRKEPQRRYSSVEQLIEDLRRHLDGQPIAARRDSALYRSWRFVARHRAAVLAAGLVVLALVAGLVSTVLQMRRAQLEQARTEQVAGFLVGLFESVDPAVARGAEPTAREILDRGARDLLAGRSAGAGPEVQATLAGTIGRVYRQLGHYAEAERLLEHAVELRRRAAERPGRKPISRGLWSISRSSTTTAASTRPRRGSSSRPSRCRRPRRTARPPSTGSLRSSSAAAGPRKPNGCSRRRSRCAAALSASARCRWPRLGATTTVGGAGGEGAGEPVDHLAAGTDARTHLDERQRLLPGRSIRHQEDADAGGDPRAAEAHVHVLARCEPVPRTAGGIAEGARDRPGALGCSRAGASGSPGDFLRRRPAPRPKPCRPGSAPPPRRCGRQGRRPARCLCCNRSR